VQTTVREPRAEKVAVVNDVRARFRGAEAAILTEYRGLSVADLQVLRRALKAVGSEYRIYKNTLVKRAAKEAGLSVLDSMLEGPTAIAFVSKDISLVAKVLRDFARTNPHLVVKGGLIGASALDAPSTNALAELPSRDVLLAQFAGALAAPLQHFAGLLAALPQKFAYGIAALRDVRRKEAGFSEDVPGEDAAVEVPIEAPRETEETEETVVVEVAGTAAAEPGENGNGQPPSEEPTPAVQEALAEDSGDGKADGSPEATASIEDATS
jgi:large subunit ribosomal protein L10